MSDSVFQSILNSTKKVLGIEHDYDAFDVDITMHINSVFSTLQQLGVGPPDSFFITGPENTWDEFFGEAKNVNETKTYVYLRVRLLFDPPATSFVIASMERQIEQLEWRLLVQAEGEKADDELDRRVPRPLWDQGYEVGSPQGRW